MSTNSTVSKSMQLAESLEERILRGDYLLRPFPRDASLAREAQVDRRTARKAVEILIGKGLLLRKPNSSVTINRENACSQIALLLPAYPSPLYERWHRSIEAAARRRGQRARVIGYSHRDDHVIHAALSEFDGTFFCMDSSTTSLSATLVGQLQRHAHRVVVLDADLSNLGLSCLWLASPLLAVHQMLDYLMRLGHQQIAFLNTQPHDQVTRLRLQQWRFWTAMHADDAVLLDEPVESYESAAPKAYEVMKRELVAGTLKATAILCATSACAIGANRAIHERGLQVGRDLSLCSLDDAGGDAPLLTPSLTCVRYRDPAPYLDICLDWMQDDSKEWIGPRLIQPAAVDLFEGESTSRCKKQ